MDVKTKTFNTWKALLLRQDYTYRHLLPSILRHPNLQIRKQKSKSQVLIFLGISLKSELDFSFVTINLTVLLFLCTVFQEKKMIFNIPRTQQTVSKVIRRGKHLVTTKNTNNV